MKQQEITSIQRSDHYDKNPELIRRFRAGDKEAGEALVELNRPLVYSLCGRFRERGCDMSDVIESGTMGLVKAIKTFDPDRGYAFSTYAVPLVLGEIRRFLRDDGILKVSREEKRLCVLLTKERERRLQSGEPSDIDSLSRAVGVSRQDAASALFSETPVRSLDESVYEDDGSVTLGSTVADEEEDERTLDRIAIKMAMEKLSDLHRRLVVLRYFKDLSQQRTAEMLGLSQVKVSREEKKIMEILRRELA